MGRDKTRYTYINSQNNKIEVRLVLIHEINEKVDNSYKVS